MDHRRRDHDHAQSNCGSGRQDRRDTSGVRKHQTDDAEDLARKLSALAALTAARRAEMGRAGREWIAWEFSAAAYRDRTLALVALRRL